MDNASNMDTFVDELAEQIPTFPGQRMSTVALGTYYQFYCKGNVYIYFHLIYSECILILGFYLLFFQDSKAKGENYSCSQFSNRGLSDSR